MVKFGVSSLPMWDLFLEITAASVRVFKSDTVLAHLTKHLPHTTTKMHASYDVDRFLHAAQEPLVSSATQRVSEVTMSDLVCSGVAEQAPSHQGGLNETTTKEKPPKNSTKEAKRPRFTEATLRT